MRVGIHDTGMETHWDRFPATHVSTGDETEVFGSYYVILCPKSYNSILLLDDFQCWEKWVLLVSHEVCRQSVKSLTEVGMSVLSILDV